MRSAEEVRKEAEDFLPWRVAKEMLLAYADLLEAMEELNNEGAHYMVGPIAIIRTRAAEKQKARKG